jgi:hypothetical protein
MYLRRRRFTIVVFQILDIKSNYLPGIVQSHKASAQGDYSCKICAVNTWTFWGLFLGTLLAIWRLVQLVG